MVILLSGTGITCKGQTLGEINEAYEYAGIKSKTFRDLSQFGKQRSQHWCWAACVQMVLNYYGVLTTQEEVVNRCFGKLIDKGATPNVMFKALNGWRINVFGNPIEVSSNDIGSSAKEITAFLLKKKPLVVGLDQGNAKIGHAYVLFGIYFKTGYDKNGEKTYKPHSVMLVDPWPGNPNIKDMSWEEFTQRVFVTYKIWTN